MLWLQWLHVLNPRQAMRSAVAPPPDGHEPGEVVELTQDELSKFFTTGKPGTYPPPVGQ